MSPRRKELRNMTDEELAARMQELTVERAEVEAEMLAAIEPVRAELDRRAFLAGFTPEQLRQIAEAAGGDGG